MLIPTSKNPPAKVKDKGLIRLARAGAAAFDAANDRILWLPLGVALLRRIREGLSCRFEKAGAQPVRVADEAAGTLPVAVRALKNEDQLPLCLMEDKGKEILLEGFDAEGALPGWPSLAERVLSFLQERGMALSVFEEATSTGARTVIGASCDADSRGALEGRTCPHCGWAGSIDVLLGEGEKGPEEAAEPLEAVLTPNATTIVELCRQLNCSPERTIKTMFYAGEKDGRKHVAAALVRGDRSVCVTKLSRALGFANLRRAESADLKQAGCDVAGFLGPVGLPGSIGVIADKSVEGTKNRVIGANRPEHHYTGACWGRDYEAPVADISGLEPGAPCPVCGKSVEKGWILPVAFFENGHPASGAFPSLGYIDGNRKRHVPGAWNGRILVEAVALASAGEGDAPFKAGLAPADVLLVPLQEGGDPAMKAAQKASLDLEEAGWAVLLDDRALPDENRLAEGILVGAPIRVLVPGAATAEVSLGGGNPERVPCPEIVAFLERGGFNSQ